MTKSEDSASSTPETHIHYDECDEVGCTTSKKVKVLTGRRALRQELQATHKVHSINTNDSSRLVKMAPRSLRRFRQGDNFRPVYHHGIPTKLEHKAVIAAMKVHKNGRKQASFWQPQVTTARACVSFGLAVKTFLAFKAQEEMDLRHATLKADGLWVTHK